MPVYLLHGFRWPREGHTGIRVHTIVHNLENCSAEYVQNENSREELLGSFKTLYPDLMQELESNGNRLDFIEQYDPEDTESTAAVSQPHAFVADTVVELAGQSIAQPPESSRNNPTSSKLLLSLNVEDVVAKGSGLTTVALEAIANLRDKIAAGEKIGWWVVYNGDPERAFESEDEDKDDDDDEEVPTPTAETAQGGTLASSEQRILSSQPPPVFEDSPAVPAKASSTSLGSILLPKRSKPEILRPEAVLPSPKDEKIPEPPKLKEAAKTSGFRKKFFGKKV